MTWLALLLAGGGCAPVPGQEVPYVVTPPQVVDGMLRLAGVGREDVVYDLGSGDGRIVIAAARDFGARGVGIEIDPRLVAQSSRTAQRAGLSERVRFVQQDLFATDLHPATVVTLYLTRELNLRLRPKLLQELRPGARVVSHHFDMGDWPADRHLAVDLDRSSSMIYLWVIPPGR
ncbi:MAG TPA: class I SAM-dependent methyltransferase [Methylomirabilota bacterium]|nr:class I SAM-dependent methyltransferase [Methylomirabilota bacterium]